MNKSSLDPKPGDTQAYLEIPEDQRRTIVAPETVWAKIGDDGSLETVRWDIIEVYARQYDESDKYRSQTHIICKLMVLVRDTTRKEYEKP